MGDYTIPEDICKALGARKNSIRLRAHTTEWKPHVYLRRVDLDLDSDEENEAADKRVAYYGLFAAKQINVKPGKEILFAIPGLGFDAQSLVFEVKEKGEEDEDEDEDAEDIQDDNKFHPKKRKGWSRPQLDPAILASFIPGRVPIYADAAVQVELDAPAATEGIAKQDVQVQVDPPSLPARCEIAIQVDDVQADESSGTSAEQAIIIEDDNEEFCPPGLTLLSEPMALAEPPVVSEIEVVASREATPMDLESAPGSPVLDEVAIQSPPEVTESETPPSVAVIAMDVEAALSTTTNLASAPAVVAIPRSVSRAANQAVVRPSSIASVPAPAIAQTSPSPTALIGLPAQASTPPSSSMTGTTVGVVNDPHPPAGTTALAFTPVPGPQATITLEMDATRELSDLAQVKDESDNSIMSIDTSKSPDSLPPPEVTCPQDPCWLITAPWRHGLLVEVYQSRPSPLSKGYLSGEREGTRAVVIFFNFFGSVPSSDTMAKVCFLADGTVSFIPIKYIAPVPPSAPGEYAVTIQGPAAGITVKTLETRAPREWSVIVRSSRLQSVMSADVLCRLEWGQGPPSGFLQDPAPQQPVHPGDFLNRPRAPLDGFDIDIPEEPKISLGRSIAMPPKPTRTQSNAASISILPSKTNEASGSETGMLNDVVTTARAASDRSITSLPPTREASATLGWMPPPDVFLPPRPTVSQNGPALGKRKRRAGRKRRNMPGQPPPNGNAYRPDYDRGGVIEEETYRPEYLIGEVVPPPQYGDSYRPNYGDGYAPARNQHHLRDDRRSPRHRRPGDYAPSGPSRSRSKSRDDVEEDIASSREASPASHERHRGTDAMEMLEKNQINTRPEDDHVHPWPIVKPSHFNSLSGADGAALEVKGVIFSPSGKMLTVCCGDDVVRVFDVASRSQPFMLRHEWPVASVAWLDGAAGLMTIGTNGVITKWTPLMSQTPIRWISAKVHDTKMADPIAFAFSNGRVAVVYAKDGVKMWEWSKGVWAELRGIKRSGVTAIQFIHEGSALLGATADGVVWYCEVPNGTMRATTFFKQKIRSLSMDPSGTRALVTLENGHAHIISTPAKGKLGEEEKVFQSDQTPSGVPIQLHASAVFAGDGDHVLLGTAEHCLLLWSRMDAELLAGLHVEGVDNVDVVASQPSAKDKLGCIVTATKGRLIWWPQPELSDSVTEALPPNKRVKLD